MGHPRPLEMDPELACKTASPRGFTGERSPEGEVKAQPGLGLGLGLGLRVEGDCLARPGLFPMM